MILNSQDWYRAKLDWPLSHGPNQNFAYSTGASSLMSVILNNISGQNPQSFIHQYMYEPLDINLHHWELVGSNVIIGQGISDFPRDIAPLGFGLWLSPNISS